MIEDFNILDAQEEEDWFVENSSRPSNLMLMRFFENIVLKKLSHNKIIIFLDEIDILISRKFKNDFLRFIRSCYDRRSSNPDFNRIVFCMLGVIAPFDLITDTTQRFNFNIGKDIELTLLDYEEAEQPLIQGLLDVIKDPKTFIEKVFFWTNGQPFLTQKLCQLAVENAENQHIDIDKLVTIRFIENWESSSGLIKDHLKNISNCVLSKDRESDPVSLLITLGRIIEEKVIKYNPQDLQHIQLKLSGLIRIESQNILIANNFYAEIFNKVWIQDQLVKLPKSWFPQGDLQEMIYFAPPSPLIQGIVKFIETRKMIIISAICLLCIDILSLYTSYYLFSSPAWISHFNQNEKGAFIEFIRSFFLVSFAAFSFHDLFKIETIQILTYDRHWWIRTCLAVLCFLFLVFVSIYHLHLGPRYLAEKHSLPSNISWFQNYAVPYLCFLPYAIINFVVISIPLISVTIYSSITNISNNIKNFKIFDQSMEKTNNYIQIFHSLSPSDKEDINEEMLRTFEELSTNFYKDFTRYSILLTGVVLLFIFELTLGRTTLADATLALTLIDYSFCWVSIIIIFFCGGIEYQKTFKKAYNLLESTGGNASQFRTTHNLLRLILKGASHVRNNKYVCFMMFSMTIFSILLYHR